MVAVAPAFARLIDPRRIDPALQSLAIGMAVRELAGRMRGHAAVTDPAGLERDFMRCLAHRPINLFPGLVLPHVRTAAVSDFILAVGRSPRGIVIPSADSPIRLIVLLASPASRLTEHLAIVSDLARQLVQPGIADRMAATESADELAELLRPAG